MSSPKASGSGKNGTTPRKDGPAQKRPKRVTPDYLMNYASWYLERFAASRARLEKLMLGKIRLSVTHYDTNAEEATEWMKNVLTKCEKAGFINDSAYAIGRARTLLRKGKALRVITADLNARGIASDQIDQAISQLKSEADEAAMPQEKGANPNLAAACAYARRRRIGPWRRPDLRMEKRDKDLAALARQGFGFDIATYVIDANPEDLEGLLGIIDGL